MVLTSLVGATATEVGAGGSVSYVGRIRLRTNEEIDHLFLYPTLDLNFYSTTN